MKHSSRNLVITLMLTCLWAMGAHSQTLVASLRTGQQVLWHRTSPSLERPDGPVLYQILFRSSAKPGFVPKIDSNFTLTNSLITEDNAGVHIGALAIASTGAITLCCGQSFGAGGAGGTVTNIATGTGLTGGPISTSGTISIANHGVTAVQIGSGAAASGQVLSANGSGGAAWQPAPGVQSVTAGDNFITIGGSAFNPTVGINTANTDLRYLQLTGGIMTGDLTVNGLTVNASLDLPFTTSASVGTITVQGLTFLHNFGTNNTFLGTRAGNLSLSGHDNTGVGSSALLEDTTGSLNSAFGSAALNANTDGENNSAFGAGALLSNTTGGQNSAFGSQALFFNTTGVENSASGYFTLRNNTTGKSNAALGTSALEFNTTGGDNAAFGTRALRNNTTGSTNAALGFHALFLSATGGDNAAVGASALSNMVSGNNNIAVGNNAGSGFTGSESNNIDIGNAGMTGESNTIRLGDGSTQTKAFITGISGSTSAGGVAVLVDSNGQLATITSSRRFKQDIADLGSESDVLMKLRPVAFYYKRELDSTQTRQYGLVAEEVAQVAPGLVVFDQDGRPQTVRYHFVNAMLLNEVQKQRRLIEQQQKQLTAQREQIVVMQHQMKALMRPIAVMQRCIQQAKAPQVATLTK
jgi:hypothetical protein